MENTTKEVKTTEMTSEEKARLDKIFKGVDEDAELNVEESKQLTEFETMNKEQKDIEFDKIQVKDLGFRVEHRRIPVPRHRFAPLKSNWDSILKTLVEHMKLQVRMNTKRRGEKNKEFLYLSYLLYHYHYYYIIMAKIQSFYATIRRRREETLTCLLCIFFGQIKYDE